VRQCLRLFALVVPEPCAPRQAGAAGQHSKPRSKPCVCRLRQSGLPPQRPIIRQQIRARLMFAVVDDFLDELGHKRRAMIGGTGQAKQKARQQPRTLVPVAGLADNRPVCQVVKGSHLSTAVVCARGSGGACLARGVAWDGRNTGKTSRWHLLKSGAWKT
jgi:hypothetical protein